MNRHWHVRKAGVVWVVYRHARPWAMHATHAQALAHAVAEAHRMGRS